LIYIPLDLMFGTKPPENSAIPRTVLPAWRWTDPVYAFSLPINFAQIRSVQIDPSKRMADIDQSNNVYLK